MDFFNKMRSGFLMSRITNDTRMMQTALSSISSDLFKQPVAIVGGIAVLLYMDWKFTIVTLVLFPSCLVPLSMYGKRARKAVSSEQEGMGQMVVTMQETFAGIRVIKSFAREEHQEKLPPQQQPVPQLDANFALDGSGRPIRRRRSPQSVSVSPSFTFMSRNCRPRNSSPLIGGIFLLYEPIKTLSRMHIMMQRSIPATTEIFAMLDSEADRARRPRRAGT